MSVTPTGDGRYATGEEQNDLGEPERARSLGTCRKAQARIRVGSGVCRRTIFAE
jgi:hypothetical protein